MLAAQECLTSLDLAPLPGDELTVPPRMSLPEITAVLQKKGHNAVASPQPQTTGLATKDKAVAATAVTSDISSTTAAPATSPLLNEIDTIELNEAGEAVAAGAAQPIAAGTKAGASKSGKALSAPAVGSSTPSKPLSGSKAKLAAAAETESAAAALREQQAVPRALVDPFELHILPGIPSAPMGLMNGTSIVSSTGGGGTVGAIRTLDCAWSREAVSQRDISVKALLTGLQNESTAFEEMMVGIAADQASWRQLWESRIDALQRRYDDK
jgi:hypothetical protein